MSQSESRIENFRLTLDGVDHTVAIAAGQTLLEAAQTAGIEAPNLCTKGRCGTCMSLLRSGDVEMASTHALSPRKIKRGYVLACQAMPNSCVELWLDFDL